MRSSTAAAGRALMMLACVVALPAFALSGAPWSGMVKKLQDLPWPAAVASFLNPTPAPRDEAPVLDAAIESHATQSNLSLAPAHELGLTNPAQIRSGVSSEQLSATADAAVVPAGYQETVKNPESESNTSPSNGLDAILSSSDPIGSIGERLQKLGATYYLLESWGNDQNMYRFHCKMAVGANPDYTRYFESIQSDSLGAMVEVLRQVEAWKTSSMAQR